MNNFKKIGLTALGTSLIAISAHAGDLAVTGSASLEIANENGVGATDNNGKKFAMGNSVNFAGSTELDNGLTISMAFELDQGAEAGTAGAAAKGPFDSHSMTISSDSMGTLVFAGHGGDSAYSNKKDQGIDAWDIEGTTTGITPPVDTVGDNTFLYTAPAMMDGLAIQLGYVPVATASHASSVSYSAVYTGVDGLTLGYAAAEDNKDATQIELDTMYVSYAYGPVTVLYQTAETESTATDTTDKDMTSYMISYTVSDDISISYGVNTNETSEDATDVDGETKALKVSYTSGGVTLTAATVDIENYSHSETNDSEAWDIGISFAF
jgi:outer membrane protein OmpU